MSKTYNRYYTLGCKFAEDNIASKAFGKARQLYTKDYKDSGSAATTGEVSKRITEAAKAVKPISNVVPSKMLKTIGDVGAKKLVSGMGYASYLMPGGVQRFKEDFSLERPKMTSDMSDLGKQYSMLQPILNPMQSFATGDVGTGVAQTVAPAMRGAKGIAKGESEVARRINKLEKAKVKDSNKLENLKEERSRLYDARLKDL